MFDGGWNITGSYFLKYFLFFKINILNCLKTDKKTK